MAPRSELLQFIELPSFTQAAARLLDDDDLALLQHVLNVDARAGVVMPGTGGLRKLRIDSSGRGKRGGGRVVYLYVKVRQRIYLMAVFAKNDKPDLTGTEYRHLRSLVNRLKMEA